VFLVFFLVVYGLLTYGFIFTAQQSLNLAADEGARHALRWPGTGAAAQRAEGARREAQRLSAWIGRMGQGAVAVTVCGPSGVLQGNGQCSGLPLAGDQIEVLVRYGYRRTPLLPLLPGMARLVPDTLSARASVRLGGPSPGAAPDPGAA